MNDLAQILVPLAITVVMALLARGRKAAAATTSDGALVLTYPRFVRGVFVVMAVVASLLAGVGVVLTFAEDMPTWARAALGLGVLLLSWPVPYLWRERDIIALVDGRGVHLRDWRRRHRSIAWDDLRDLKYSAWNQRWKLVGSGGEALRISSLLQGATELPTRIRHNVAAPRWRRWGHEIERYQKAQKQLEARR